MRILVTGAAGFVGSAVVRTCADHGHEAHAFMRCGLGKPESAVPVAQIFVGEIGDPTAIACAAAGCDVVVHAVYVSDPAAGEELLDWTLVAGTENVLRAAAHAKCRRMVMISCADVTLHDGDRVNWDDARVWMGKPVGRHARSMKLAEELLLSASGPQIETVALRPMWVWGRPNAPFERWLRAAAKGGTYTMIGAGENLLATTHIDRLTFAALAAAEAPDVGGRAFYVVDDDLEVARDVLTRVSASAGLESPRSGLGLSFVKLLARARVAAGGEPAAYADVLRLGRSTSFATDRRLRVPAPAPVSA